MSLGELEEGRIRGESHGEMEAEVGVTPPQTKECLGPWEP